MLAFHPAEGQSEVHVVNVGIAGSEGLPLERAALSMPELQVPVLDENGEPTGERVPLTGDKLCAAAEAWARSAGLVVADQEGTVLAPVSEDPPAETPPTPGMGDVSPQPPVFPVQPDPTIPGPLGPVQEA